MRRFYLGLVAMMVSTFGFAQTYCTTGLYTNGCAFGDDLDDVTIGNFQQTNTGCTTGGFADYTSDTIDIAQTDPTLISLTSNFSSQWYAVWIDANDDGDFDDAGEFLWNSTSPTTGTGVVTSGTFAIDTSVSVGTHRLRVRGKFSGSAITSSESCTNFSYGEVHDYTVNVLPPPACPTPLNLFATNVTSTSVWIHWSGIGSNYTVEYGPFGYTQGTGTTVSSTVDSVQITGLTPATTYTFYVQNNCSGSGNGLSNWSPPLNVLTACAPFTVPYTEDFDNTTTGNTSNPNAPTCWTYYETPGHAGWGYTYTSSFNTAYSLPNMFYFYNSSNTTDSIMIISPEIIGLDSSNKQVTFYAKTNTASYDSPLIVGTMSDPLDPTSFNTIATVTATQNFQEFIVALDSAAGFNGTDKHVAFMYVNANTFDACYLDEITIDNIPPCPKPNLLSLGTGTSSTQVINWVSGGSQFVVEYGPAGFTQGTGMLDTVTTNSANISGLAPNTLYDAYVLNDCSGAGNGISVWSGPITFKTQCIAQAVPLFEGFESADAGNSVNMTLPDCWFMYEAGPSTAYGYATASTTQIRTGSRAYYTYCVGSTSDTFMLISPEIAGMDTSYKRIEMWIRAASSSTFYDNKVVIGTVSSPTNPGSFVAIDTLDIGSNTTYQYHQIYFDPANGYNQSDRFIAIMTAGAGSSSPTLVTYDDITISNIPQCTPSSNISFTGITNNASTAQWVPGDGSSFQIEYGPQGFTQGTGAPIASTTDSSYTMTGLSSNTCYDVYVRDSCSTGSFSPWFGPFTFCTLCDAQNTPIAENFDMTPTGNTTDPSMPDCWFYYETPGHPGWGYTYTSSFNQANSAPNQFYLYNSSSIVDTLMIISPAVVNMSAGDKLLKFWAKSGSSFYDVPVMVGTMGSPNDPSTLTPLDTVIANSTYAEFTIYLDTASGYNGTDQHIVIGHAGGTTFDALYLDDISIEQIPSCTPPWNLGASNITASSASINWTTLQGTCFKVEYGPTGFVQGTGNGITISNTTSPTTITGLNPNTFYDVYVADCCDSTVFAGPFTFKSNCVNQLNGTYTVGGATADFATLDSAMSTLVGCGVTGPVTLDLQGGAHTIGSQQVGNILGVSATNTVTIKGGGPAVDTILFGAGSLMGFDFDGGGHFIFEDLTVNGAATQRTFWLHNGANNISFDNCHLWNDPATTSSITGVIVGAESATSNFSTGNNASNLSLKDCKVIGGYTGVWVYGLGTTSYTSGYTIENCEFTDQSTYGIRFYYCEDITVTDNIVTAPLPSYGMYNYYQNDITIERNQLFGTTSGFYSGYVNIYRSDTPTVRSTIKNNFFGASGTYAQYNYAARHLDYVHNSINGTGTYGAYFSATTSSTLASYDVNMFNNIFQGGSNYALYCFAQNYQSLNSDYNIYNTGGTNLAYWTAARADLAALKAADTAQNQNSLSGAPGYASATDLHIVGTLPNDAGINGYATNDIDGDSRPASGSTTVDIGADEFTPLNWDASLEALIVPLGGCGDSTTEVSAIVKNFGLNTITTLPITVDITGGVTATVNVNANVNIPQGGSDTVVVGTFNTYAGAAGVMFMGYTQLANDQKSTNDTLAAGPGAYIPAEPVTHNMLDTVCASVDSVDLYAISIPGTEYGWWDAATGGNKVATGDTVTVPTNGPSTDYVQYDSATANPQVGAGTIASASTFPPLITPYKTYYMDGRVQYLVLASEMAALGIAGGGEINSLAFEVATAATQALNDFTIKMGSTSVTQMTTTYQPTAGMTTVYNSSSYTTSAGWNVHTFSTPFIWNGADNILIEVCFDNSSWTSNSTVYYTTTSFTSVTDGYADLSSSSGCTPGGITNQQATSDRPNMQFNIKTIACSQVRKPVSFVVSPDSAYASFTHTVQANGADVDFDATASVGQVYTWDFGDMNTGTGITPTHTYANAGTYNVCLTVEDTSCGAIDSVCQTVVATIGLDETLIGQTMNLYPNPNNGNFRVEFQVEGLKNVELRVLSTLGEVLYISNPGNVSGTYREEIDLSDEAAGVYILQVVSDDGTTSRRVTIRK